NYTLRFNDTFGQPGIEDHVYIYVLKRPESNQPPDIVAKQNDTGIIILWTLTSPYGPGHYRILRNSTEIQTWQPWPGNNTAINVSVNTNLGIGYWMYSIEYNDTNGLQGNPDTVIVIVNDKPVASAAGTGNYTVIPENASNYIIQWTITDAIGGSGFYNVSVNNNTILENIIWNSGETINISINTNAGHGIFNYTMTFQDTFSATGDQSTIIVQIAGKPISNHPNDVIILQQVGAANITWVLTDQQGPGHFRVLCNNSIYLNWTAWTNNTDINIIVDNNKSIGYWNYTIQYNNTYGFFGQQDTVFVISDDIPRVVKSPTPAEFECNTTQFLSWILVDGIGAGNYTILLNGTPLQNYVNRSWINNTEITVPVNTNIGFGPFNYTIIYYDSNGFKGNESSVIITVVESQPESQNQVMQFIEDNPWVIIIGIAALVAIATTIIVLSKKKKAGKVAKKKITTKKPPEYKMPETLEDSTTTTTEDTTASDDNNANVPPDMAQTDGSTSNQQRQEPPSTTSDSSTPPSTPPSTPTRARTRPQDTKISQTSQEIVKTTSNQPHPGIKNRFYCGSCKKYTSSAIPQQSGWFICPTCKQDMLAIIKCQACNQDISINRQFYLQYKNQTVNCPHCKNKISLQSLNI
ncbi:MAG: hypothetical protein ACTSWN_16590, partial [Promethearchaeota archaeon]